MTITLTFGLWVIPTIISLFIYFVTWCLRTESSGFVDFSPIANMVKFGLATILVLIVWLIYALAS
jgi:uncharacterized Tic20 family protein